MSKHQLSKSSFSDLYPTEIKNLLVESDRYMARVFEDAVKALLKKGILRGTDLPDCARIVLDARAKLREALEEKTKKDKP